VNLTKPDSLFSRGMQPVMYSCAAAQRHSQGWYRAGKDISYHAYVTVLLLHYAPSVTRDPNTPGWICKQDVRTAERSRRQTVVHAVLHIAIPRRRRHVPNCAFLSVHIHGSQEAHRRTAAAPRGERCMLELAES
jgi:hypothetical protein